MKIRTLFYVIGQGFKNLFKNKWFTMASIATISACLFLFSIVFAIFVNLQRTMESVEEGVSLTVFFTPESTDEQKYDIGEKILARPEVASCRYISGDEAWEVFKVDYLKEYADGFTENPLAKSDNYEVYINDVTQQSALVTYISTLPGVRKVNSSELTANILAGMNSLVAYIAYGVIIILLAVSIFLISNTVMIGISVRKEEIAIMKFVGATDFFVRAPFIIEGVLIGAIGSVIPLFIIYEVYNRFNAYIASQFAILARHLTFVDMPTLFHELGPACVILGVGIGFFGSVFTVKKHLRV